MKYTWYSVIVLLCTFGNNSKRSLDSDGIFNKLFLMNISIRNDLNTWMDCYVNFNKLYLNFPIGNSE